MKRCLCCGIEANADVSTCANCGEGSWLIVKSKLIGTNEAISAELIESVIVHSDNPIVTDPETTPDVPARRRNRHR